ncbi:uncharacterized protein LOC62_05G006836 [Vanrija pseudolonga]|uniref:DUF3224 domain-containing protein n=1 Tax=Vanrija pseudolonga TaxID=143232 RepID=A0AAF1BJY8_9TREE|nr:hypothetical protein LOC62_05G006836 [Vanrija pseudolonga]
MPTHITTTFDFDRIAFHTITSEHGSTRLPGAMTTEAEFKGAEMAGKAVTHFATIAYGPDDGDKAFHGISVFTGSILGKAGSVAFTIAGQVPNGTELVETDYVLLPSSASGELKGIKGTGRAVGAPGQQEGIVVTFDVEFA